VADGPAKNAQVNTLLQTSLNTMQVAAAASFYAT
jgi:hypothetical protein